MNKLPLALSYLQKGYSVLPCDMEKRPLFSWKEMQEKKPTVEEMAGWWQMFPDAQVGIVTGDISNLTVVDIEKDGDFGIIDDKTYVVETGGGGRHAYFQYDPDFKNAVRLLPNIDIRTQGGFVVAAGSKTTKGSYKVLNDLPVAKMSEKTKTLLLEAANRQKSPFQGNLNASKPLEPLIYEGASQGSRNDLMTKHAGSICARVHYSLWDTIGWQMFEDANSKNVPPLSEHELRSIWKSITVREQRQNPNGRIFNFDKPKVWGPEEKKKEEPAPNAHDKFETLHIAQVASLQLIDSKTAYPIDMPPIDDALLGGFSAGEVVIVAGQSGHGKTTCVQDWSATLATGGGGRRVQLPTLWFSYEVLAMPLWEKFQKMGVGKDTPIFMPSVIDSGDIDWIGETIEQAITMWGIKAVAIDHIGFVRPPRGNYANAADSITHTVRALKTMAVKHGLIFMLPVHIRKTVSRNLDLNDIRDSLGIAQESDAVFFIAREKDSAGLPSTRSMLSLAKNRKSGIATSCFLDFHDGRYYYSSDQMARRQAPERKPYYGREGSTDFGDDF